MKRRNDIPELKFNAVVPPVYKKRHGLKTVVSYEDRGTYGSNKYRGNCSGRPIADIFDYYEPKTVMDPSEGSGTCGDVARERGIHYKGFDLVRGSDQDLFKRPWDDEQFDLVWWHPPYGDMIRYGEDPADLSHLRGPKFAARLVEAAELLFTTAVRPGGHLVILIGTQRKNGKVFRYWRDLMNWREPSEPEIIKVQHNVRSSGFLYGRKFIPIIHEHILIWRRPEK